ncbi:MAG: hypothetical protein GY696_00590 [Gammaproteobacteria bacterium]|nr:hypothetical protein [Gammaproteobacteria bacterium]
MEEQEGFVRFCPHDRYEFNPGEVGCGICGRPRQRISSGAIPAPVMPDAYAGRTEEASDPRSDAEAELRRLFQPYHQQSRPQFNAAAVALRSSSLGRSRPPSSSRGARVRPRSSSGRIARGRPASLEPQYREVKIIRAFTEVK